LTSAAREGFFWHAASRDYARHDSDLAILANRDEFRKLADSEGGKP
jgi:hypothetical protein